MRTIILLLAVIASTYTNAEETIYKLPFATINNPVLYVGGLYSVEVNEFHLMPSFCGDRSTIYISDQKSPNTSKIAYRMLLGMYLDNIPAVKLNYTMDGEGVCWLDELEKRDIATDPWDIDRVYAHPIIMGGKFQAENCPDPFEPTAVMAFQFQDQSPSDALDGRWSPKYGGHMKQLHGKTCVSNNLLPIGVKNGWRMRWRPTTSINGYSEFGDWVYIIADVP